MEEYSLYEEVDEQIDRAQARRLARSCLVNLFSENPDQHLLSFLRTGVGETSNSETRPEEETIVPAPASADLTQLPDFSSESLAKSTIRLLEGNELDDDLAALPGEFATFLLGLQAGQVRKFLEARLILETLPAESILRPILDQYLRTRESSVTGGTGEVIRGLRVAELEPFSGEYLETEDEIIGYCTRSDRPNAVFVRPVGILRAGKASSLSEGDAVRLFPETGTLISFAGGLYPKQPMRGDIGVWRVSEHETEKRTRFHLVTQTRELYETQNIPFPSIEPDAVREYLKALASAQSGERPIHVVYVLNDGLVLALRPERRDLAQDQTYENGLLAWETLDSIRVDGRSFVIGPIPKNQSVYECGSLASAARNLLRAKNLPKAVINDVIRAIDGGEALIGRQRLTRLRAELAGLSTQQDAVDAIAKELVERDDVRNRVEQLVNAEIVRRAAKRDELLTDIDRLTKEKNEWTQRIDKEREQHRQLRDDTTKTVRGAFDKALKEGLIKLRTEAAIFDALSSNPSMAQSSVPALPSSRGPTIRVTTEIARQGESGVEILRRYGLPRAVALAITVLTTAVHQAGLSLVVQGTAARPLVLEWMRNSGFECTVLDVPVGVLDESTVRDVLGDPKQANILMVCDANLSPMDVYARPLSDLLLFRAASANPGTSQRIVLTLSPRGGGAPIASFLPAGRHRDRPGSQIRDETGKG